jgi:hypothetical protein
MAHKARNTTEVYITLDHFKELEPIPQFKATAQLGEFLECRFSQSF